MRNIEIGRNEKGHWIHVRTEDDKYGAIRIEGVVNGVLTQEAFCEWIDERIEDGETGQLI